MWVLWIEFWKWRLLRVVTSDRQCHSDWLLCWTWCVILIFRAWDWVDTPFPVFDMEIISSSLMDEMNSKTFVLALYWFILKNDLTVSAIEEHNLSIGCVLLSMDSTYRFFMIYSIKTTVAFEYCAFFCLKYLMSHHMHKSIDSEFASVLSSSFWTILGQLITVSPSWKYAIRNCICSSYFHLRIFLAVCPLLLSLLFLIDLRN